MTTTERGLPAETSTPVPAPVTPLTEPADGLPDVVATQGAFARVVEAFAAGSGPVAADAERASGYRYGQATYLVQVRREGAGTALIDPVGVPDLSPLGEAVGDAEFVLHAASQDLPGFAEHGLRPARIFDTELAARLLGMERVGLAAVVAEVLGLGLAKEHSAVDWSTRPLPEDWLRYAALDVEVLVELRDRLAERLEAAGKTEWAAQEFEAVRTAPPPPPRVDPWRRTSGMHVLRNPRQVGRSGHVARPRRERPGPGHLAGPRAARPGDRRGGEGHAEDRRPARRPAGVRGQGHQAPGRVLAEGDRRRARPARVGAALGARAAFRRSAAAAHLG
jgi:ribonuclease D